VPEGRPPARYVRLREGDGDATLAAINADKPNACTILHVAFFMGEKGENITNQYGTWQVTKILVVGVFYGEVFSSTQPLVQWSAFYVEEKGA
jgi:hypothetical protein